MPEFVKFINDGDTEWKFEQSNKRRQLAPNEDAIVPWHLAASLFGSPGIQDVGNNKHRAEALKKKRALNGFQEGFETVAQFDERRANIRVIDLETNERIYMLMEDPDGEHMGTAPVSADKTDAEALQRQISTLQNEMQRLLNRISGPQDAVVSDSTGVTPSTDGPSFEDIPDDSADDVSSLIPQADTAATEDTPQAVDTAPDEPAPKAPRRSRAKS